ncbi:hypothetical protein NCC49_006435 [Naganishia albida]|nr:hypothetical protein NCC49_006435 [Naganishia albida]
MNFSPYQDPPDAPRDTSSTPGVGKKGKTKRPWFSRDASSYGNSYQSGGSGTDPTLNPSYLTNDPESGIGSSSAGYTTGGFGSDDVGGLGVAPASANVWDSRLGLRVDVMAALAYLGGPLAALVLLILETVNDYVRFHAYQSALLTTPLFVVWMLMRLIGFWSWLRKIFLIFSLTLTGYTAFRAFRDPNTMSVGPQGQAQQAMMSSGVIPRFYLPVIGDFAERWVGEE